MKTHLMFFALLCCVLFLSAAPAPVKPKLKAARDYSCSYFNDFNGKYYCVETSAACSIAHAYVKESTSTASPVLVVCNQTSSGTCPIFEGSMQLADGSIIVIDVVSCGCGSSITTHVFFTR
jgi:hypothetical protein